MLPSSLFSTIRFVVLLVLSFFTFSTGRCRYNPHDSFWAIFVPTERI